MFKNYLIIAFRNLRKQKAYAFINITGFAVGLAACILIMLYVLSELSYDKFHENAGRIYRVGIEGNVSGNYVKYPLSNLGTGFTMQKDYAEVESFTRIYSMSRMPVKHRDQSFFEEDMVYADKSFFEVFSFPLSRGNPNTALEVAYSIVLTSEMAIKYFGNEDPMGKQLRLNNRYDYVVTGIVENVPKNSHLQFDFLCSIESFYVNNDRKVNEWENFNNYTYLLLSENVNPAKFAEKFPAFLDKHLSNLLKLMGGEMNFFLQPMTDIHLYSNLGYEMPGNSDIAYIYIFSSIAFVILLIACINFMNLATARSAGRAKEVGLRKVVGAEKKRLVFQFLTESMAYCIVSLIFAIILVKLAIPVFNTIAGIELGFRFNEMPWLIPIFFGFTLFAGFLAGSYPAFFLSSFQPINVMRGALKVGGANSRFRGILVVVQFVISITLIIGTMIMLDQLRYMKEKDLGFDKEHVVIIPIFDDAMTKNLESIRNELKSLSGVIDVSSASDVPGNYPDYTAYVPEGYTREQTQLMHHINCEENFIRTMGMEIIEGRNFSSEFGTDHEDAIIINQTTAKKYGWDSPLGKQIGFFPEELADKTEPKTVIGVVKDFHVKSMHDKILPLLLTNDKTYFNEVVVRIKSGDISGSVELIGEKWKEFDPNRPFDYYFLDQSFNKQYQADERLNTIIRYFTIFAIFVACLGLYGMASFMAEQRFKEIGVRKTLGASVPNIVLLLSKEITRLIIIANVLAIPIVYFVLEYWLESFAYHTEISILTFLFSTLIVFIIGYITISYQSLRAAFTNPVDVMRTE